MELELSRWICKMLLMTLVSHPFMIAACRMNAITFKSFTKTLTIRNRKIARILIAEKTTWGVSTSREKRNKMSILGIVSWIIFLPQAYFYVYDWWIFITTGVTKDFELENKYLAIAWLFYIIAVSIKDSESGKYRKGDIW
ncbi:MAG: hypothetical protein HDR22_08005 [Lachnospiraceae bacterium]|nr:hypothetical protein [Lachnospiraceae bacterium]